MNLYLQMSGMVYVKRNHKPGQFHLEEGSYMCCHICQKNCWSQN